MLRRTQSTLQQGLPLAWEHIPQVPYHLGLPRGDYGWGWCVQPRTRPTTFSD
jgi:hypothetical protein